MPRAKNTHQEPSNQKAVTKRTASANWHVYILLCSDHSFYTGITTDLNRRVNEHNHSRKAARYTRCRRPVELVYSEPCEDRAEASRREHQLRKLSHQQKKQLAHHD